MHDKPAVAICERCGDFICGDCTEVINNNSFCLACAEKIHEQIDPKPPGLPWEQPKELGYVRSFFKTLWLFAFSPRKFFGLLANSGSYRAPILFVAIIIIVASAVTLSYSFYCDIFLRGTKDTVFIYFLVILFLPILWAVIMVPMIFSLACLYYLLAELFRSGAPFKLVFGIAAYVLGILSLFFLPVIFLDATAIPNEPELYAFMRTLSQVSTVIIFIIQVTWTYFGARHALGLNKIKASIFSLSSLIFPPTLLLFILFVMTFLFELPF